MQDSKESLERLRRMDNFESQDFDPMVRIKPSPANLQLKLCCLALCALAWGIQSSMILLQENDMERATALDRGLSDYNLEQVWKWILSGESHATTRAVP